jgi:anti-sigma B factor antagonist
VTNDRDTYPERWASGQAIMTLSGQVDVSNAGQIREQLLSLINRGAAALITDMTATLSCDHAGADALMRVYQRAVISRTHLRLVLTNPIVQRVLSVNGLDRLISIYPSLDAAVAAGTERQERQDKPGNAAITLAMPQAAHQVGRGEESLDWAVNSIFDIGVILQTATGQLPDAAEMRMTEALHRLDDVVRDLRYHMFINRLQEAQSSSATRSPLDTHQRLAQATDRAAALRERVAQTARALQSAAANTAALLQQLSGLAGQPARIDYPAEIKRWRAFADQAEQMAKHWEQRQ